jgi:hypothetical protein
MDHESKMKLSYQLGNASRPNFFRQTNDSYRMSATRFQGKKVVSHIVDK